MKPPSIYLDAHASTPVAPEAVEALVTHLVNPANPHSPHAAGAIAHEAVEAARQAVGNLIGAAPGEIFFTSGATEANNIAILGVARAAAKVSSRRSIVTSTIEHPSVLEAAAALSEEGFTHRLVPVDPDGRMDLDALAKALDDDVLLMCLMAANNVTGIIQPVREAAALARAAGAMVHCDAAQLGGRVAVDVFDLDVDFLSLSAHKMHGPPGIGALYVSATAEVRPNPLVFGGGQEQGLRSGTVPAASVAAFGVAARLVQDQRARDTDHVAALATNFVSALEELQVRFVTIGSDRHRLPGSINIAFIGCDAHELVERLSKDVALSTGSACSSGQITTSPILEAMKLSEPLKRASVRICFNRYSNVSDADGSARAIATVIREIELATGSAVQ
ncbi:MAG: cysteine desulfurase family protein [Brevundimonas sp.]